MRTLPNFKKQSKKIKRARQKVAGVLLKQFGFMKPAATKTKKRSARRKRNPFACKGWGEFIMRSVRADEAARAAAPARHCGWRPKTGDSPIIRHARRDRAHCRTRRARRYPA